MGAAVASYRSRAQPTKTASRPASWPRTEVVAFVAELRMAVTAVPVETDAGKDAGSVVDTSQSVYLAFDIVGEHGGAQFVVDDGESRPLNWKLRGCELEISDSARRTLTTRWRALRQRFGADALFTELSGAAPWPPED